VNARVLLAANNGYDLDLFSAIEPRALRVLLPPG
jgi:hypothetical protein